MSKNKSNRDKSTAIVIDPEAKEHLGTILLVGDPVPTSKLIGGNGPLQGFVLIDGREHLRQVWAHQEEVLLLTKYGQRYIKIITYPTEGENQGYLDFTSELEILPKSPSVQKNRMLTQRGFAFLQSLISF